MVREDERGRRTGGRGGVREGEARAARTTGGRSDVRRDRVGLDALVGDAVL